MARKERVELIQAIEAKRHSKVITYVTSTRPNLSGLINGDAIPIIHRHILAIPKDERQKLDLFLYSHGGNSDVPWTLVSLFREYAEKGRFSVLIPYHAQSAATVIALGADEIVMTKKAELGPIDTTLTSPYDLLPNKTEQLPISVEDVNGYFSLLKRVGIEDSAGKLQAFQELVKQVHPLSLGTVNRLLDQTELVAKRMLGSRAEPMSENQIKDIVEQLSAKIYSHNHAISRTEAIRSLGMTQIVSSEEALIDDELWALYEEYLSLFEFETTFMPDQYMIENQLEENTWAEMRFAGIESVTRYDEFQSDFVSRRLPNIPANITVNVNPTINLPQTVLQTITPANQQALLQLLQQTAQAAAIQSVLEFFKNLPTANYLNLLFNQGWKELTNA